jgi:hypothetical protein
MAEMIAIRIYMVRRRGMRLDVMALLVVPGQSGDVSNHIYKSPICGREIRTASRYEPDPLG